MALKLITAPTAEPVTLAEAKLHLRVDQASEDALINVLISAARESAEHITERALMPQTWELQLDAFPDAFRLLRGPVISVTSVKYLDKNGTLQTLDSSQYQVDLTDDAGAWVLPAYGVEWPEARADINAARVRYQAGYADAATVPAAIKSWILLMIGTLYENRELDAAKALERSPGLAGMLDRYRVWSL